MQIFRKLYSSVDKNSEEVRGCVSCKHSKYVNLTLKLT